MAIQLIIIVIKIINSSNNENSNSLKANENRCPKS